MASPCQIGGNILIDQNVATGQIGQRKGNPQNAIKAARRQRAIIDSRIEQFASARIRTSQVALCLAAEPRTQTFLPCHLCRLRPDLTLTALRHGFVGQADHGEGVLAGRQMHSHFDRHGFDTLRGNGLNIGDHDSFFFSVTKLREKRDADK